MTNKTILSSVAILVLAAAAVAAYFYYVLPSNTGAPLPPAAQPDNSISAGPIKTVTGTSITITKQDGTVATFAIGSTTRIVIEGSQTDAGTSALAAGKVVLITPNAADPKTAGSIVVTSEPPAQP